MIGNPGGSGSNKTVGVADSSPSAAATVPVVAETVDAAGPTTPVVRPTWSEPATSPVAQQVQAAPEPKPRKPAVVTSGEANALDSAQDYLNFQAFSKKGLFEQVHSSAGDGYSSKEAQ